METEAGEKIFVKNQKKWAKARTGTQVCFAEKDSHREHRDHRDVLDII